MTAWNGAGRHRDRKSTRLNSSHITISYAVFCLKKNERGARNTWRGGVEGGSTVGGGRACTQKMRRALILQPHDAVTRYLKLLSWIFFFNDTATTEIYTLSLHDALPI